ncbi:hypothetical protein JCM11251_003153 [Rhodosporidiobolus azoricus]
MALPTHGYLSPWLESKFTAQRKQHGVSLPREPFRDGVKVQVIRSLGTTGTDDSTEECLVWTEVSDGEAWIACCLPLSVVEAFAEDKAEGFGAYCSRKSTFRLRQWSFVLARPPVPNIMSPSKRRTYIGPLRQSERLCLRAEEVTFLAEGDRVLTMSAGQTAVEAFREKEGVMEWVLRIEGRGEAGRAEDSKREGGAEKVIYDGELGGLPVTRSARHPSPPSTPAIPDHHSALPLTTLAAAFARPAQALSDYHTRPRSGTPPTIDHELLEAPFERKRFKEAKARLAAVAQSKRTLGETVSVPDMGQTGEKSQQMARVGQEEKENDPTPPSPPKKPMPLTLKNEPSPSSAQSAAKASSSPPAVQSPLSAVNPAPAEPAAVAAASLPSSPLVAAAPSPGLPAAAGSSPPSSPCAFEPLDFPAHASSQAHDTAAAADHTEDGEATCSRWSSSPSSSCASTPSLTCPSNSASSCRPSPNDLAASDVESLNSAHLPRPTASQADTAKGLREKAEAQDQEEEIRSQADSDDEDVDEDDGYEPRGRVSPWSGAGEYEDDSSGSEQEDEAGSEPEQMHNAASSSRGKRGKIRTSSRTPGDMMTDEEDEDAEVEALLTQSQLQASPFLIAEGEGKDLAETNAAWRGGAVRRPDIDCDSQNQHSSKGEEKDARALDDLLTDPTSNDDSFSAASVPSNNRSPFARQPQVPQLHSSASSSDPKSSQNASTGLLFPESAILSVHSHRPYDTYMAPTAEMVPPAKGKQNDPLHVGCASISTASSLGSRGTLEDARGSKADSSLATDTSLEACARLQDGGERDQADRSPGLPFSTLPFQPSQPSPFLKRRLRDAPPDTPSSYLARAPITLQTPRPRPHASTSASPAPSASSSSSAIRARGRRTPRASLQAVAASRQNEEQRREEVREGKKRARDVGDDEAGAENGSAVSPHGSPALSASVTADHLALTPRPRFHPTAPKAALPVASLSFVAPSGTNTPQTTTKKRPRTSVFTSGASGASEASVPGSGVDALRAVISRSVVSSVAGTKRSRPAVKELNGGEKMKLGPVAKRARRSTLGLALEEVAEMVGGFWEMVEEERERMKAVESKEKGRAKKQRSSRGRQGEIPLFLDA